MTTEVEGNPSPGAEVIDGETLKSDPPSRKRRRGSPSSGIDMVFMANSRSSGWQKVAQE